MGLPNPLTAVGAGMQYIGKGLGDAATTSQEWLGDRAKDVVSGDALGINRRENEEMRRKFEEAMDKSDATLAEVRGQLGNGVGSGDAKGVTGTGFGEADSSDGGTKGGALSKELDASYTVADGDTLSKIAQDKGKSLDDLLGMNPELGDGNLIMPGQEIKLAEFEAQDSPVDQIREQAASKTEASPELQV